MARKQENIDKRIHAIGSEIKYRLDKQYQQWGGGLSYKVLMSPLGQKAKYLGFEFLSELVSALEKEKYIKVLNTPTGARYVFSFDNPMTEDEMLIWIQEQEINKEVQRDIKKSKPRF